MDSQTTTNESSESPKKPSLDNITDTEWRALQKADGKTFVLLKTLRERGIKDAEDFELFREALLAEPEPEPKPEQQESRAIDNIEVVNLDSVTAETVSWLWQGYIPLGKLTLIDGDPGLGKSLFSTDLASRLTTGQPMPDGSPSIQGGVVLMSLEDGLADTIVPRLNVAGADKKKIIALQGVKDADGQYRFPTIEDVSAINQACKSVNAKLLVVDPLMGYLGHKVNSHKDQDIRRALSPLAKMANETGLSIIIIRHLVKSESNNAVYRGGGSIGIIGAARSALLVAKDPENENRRILAGIKSNLAPLPPSLSYTIENVGGIPKIVWGGVSGHTADALLSIPSNPEERSALEDAKDFLKDIFFGGDVDSRDIQRQAKQAGIAERTLHRAKKALRVTSKKAEFKGGWLWAMPHEDCQESPKVAKEKGGNLGSSLATFGDSEPPEGDVLDLTNVDFEVPE